MSRATPKMRDFARRLMAYEASGKKTVEAANPGVFPVCEKLRPHLVTLMGNAGFRALISRAIALAIEEVPWLHAVKVKEDGSLEGTEKLQSQLIADEFMEGRVVLLAQLLGLLVAFIGEALTVQVVREAWPKVSPHDLNFGYGRKK